MPPQLVALTEGPNILLDKPIILLGRHQECDIQLASRKISRRHCCIAQVNDYLVVRDLCSTNGIRINGVRVQEGSLREGDELTIGNHRYQLQWQAQPAEAALARPQLPGKEAVRRTRHAPEEDVRLESCEEPIPLAEPGSGEAPLPVLPSAPAEPPPVSAAPSPPPLRPPSSHILPSQIQLAPLSDIPPLGQEPPPLDPDRPAP
jgi:predicted component of type VI protein secretion system